MSKNKPLWLVPEDIETLDAIAKAAGLNRPQTVRAALLRFAAEPPTVEEVDAIQQADRRGPPDPTPEEIESRAEEIRQGWSESDRTEALLRNPAGPREKVDSRWTPPVVKSHRPRG